MSIDSRLARRAQRPSLPPHGTRARYQIDCRCLPCRLANAEYTVVHRRLGRRQEIRARALVDAKRARAIVRALVAEGFTKTMIAHELGTTKNAFRPLGDRVTYARHQALEALYQARVADPSGSRVTECSAVDSGAK